MPWFGAKKASSSSLDPRTLTLTPEDMPAGFDLVKEQADGVLCNRHFVKAVSGGYSPAMSITVAIAKDTATARTALDMYIEQRRSVPGWQETRRFEVGGGDQSFAHHGRGLGRPGTFAGVRYGRAMATVFTDGVDDDVSRDLAARQFERLANALTNSGELSGAPEAVFDRVRKSNPNFDANVHQALVDALKDTALELLVSRLNALVLGPRDRASVPELAPGLLAAAATGFDWDALADSVSSSSPASALEPLVSRIDAAVEVVRTNMLKRMRG